MPPTAIDEALREDDDGAPEAPDSPLPRLTLPVVAELLVGALADAGYVRSDVARFAREYMQSAPGDMPIAAFHWALEVERKMPASGSVAVWDAERIARRAATLAAVHLNRALSRGGRPAIHDSKVGKLASAIALDVAQEVESDG